MLEHDSSREIEDVWRTQNRLGKKTNFRRLSVSQEIENHRCNRVNLVLERDAGDALQINRFLYVNVLIHIVM